ncbi:MAG: glycerol-3-phosphate dehydrogenase [Pseudomonadota bacterium]
MSQNNPFIFSNETRKHNLQILKTKPFDLLIVGAGINGAGAARDAALRGLNVALIDKDDFSSGTSSSSSKLIHGGLRYLETYQFKLIYESSKERRVLQKVMPSLIKPCKFIFPVYKNSKPGIFLISCGMWLYDVLATFRNNGLHKIYNRKSFSVIEPMLNKEGLVGGASYYDCIADDSRLTIENAISAHLNGAVCANYIKASSILSRNQNLSTINAVDTISGDKFEIKAKVIVNCSGPWVDKTLSSLKKIESKKIRPTKGVHFIVKRDKINNNNAIVMKAVKDNRTTFVIPWDKFTLVGTTDTDYDADLDNVYATKKDIEYLIESLNILFPEAKLSKDDIISSYAGLRPLVYEKGKNESAVSREHKIFIDDNIVTIAGGKLTTYRPMVKELIDAVIKNFPFLKEKIIKPVKTSEACLETREEFSYREKLEKTKLTSETTIYLRKNYGKNILYILDLIIKNPSLGEKLEEDLPNIKAEVPYAIQHEMSYSLIDFYRRRTQIFLCAKSQGLDSIQFVADQHASALFWDDNKKQEMIDAFKEYFRVHNKFRK